LFSNSLAPMIVGGALEVFNMLMHSNELRDKVMDNARYFKEKILKEGFDIKPSESAIIAIMLYDAKLSQDFAARLLDFGIYVIGFFYPVVPKGEARIRVQLSAAHTKEQIDRAVEAFVKVGKEFNVI